MLEGWLGGLIAASGSPTADLYLGNALSERASVHPVLQRPAPTVFLSDQTRVVMRHCGGAGPLPRRDRTIYLVDDDVEAGVVDRLLPRLYRQKLRRLELPCHRRMLREADLVIAGSEALANRLDAKGAIRVLTPCWSEAMAPLDHQATSDFIDIAFLGSGVHRADLAFLLPVVSRLLREESRVRLHLSERHRLPHAMARHPRVCRFPSGSWMRYRRGLAGRRYHLALYPLLETPFNRARSPNKLIEHAIAGAAPLYSGWWSYGRFAVQEGAGLALPHCQDAWYRSIRRLIRDPAERIALARGAARLSRRLNDPAGQRAFWQGLL